MKKFLIPSILLIVLLGSTLHRLYAKTISAEQAANFFDRQKTVCGTVAGTYFASRLRGQPAFLNLDKPCPHQTFTVLIRGSDRGEFEEPPEILYSGKEIYVTGMIKSYHGRLEIAVRNPGQIK